MTDITGADTFFTNIDSDLTQTQWESYIDQAIDKINAYGYPYDVEIPNMSGDAGSKTWTGSSAEAGWIRSIAVLVYQKEYRSAGAQSENYGIGSISHSQSASASSGSGGGANSLEDLAKEAAIALRDFDITHG